MKNMAYKCKVNRREELHYKIFDAERCMHFEYHIFISQYPLRFGHVFMTFLTGNDLKKKMLKK
jgi:hypothetical protein